MPRRLRLMPAEGGVFHRTRAVKRRPSLPRFIEWWDGPCSRPRKQVPRRGICGALLPFS